MNSNEKNFFPELLTRVINFLDPKKIALILVGAVLAGLLGFGMGELFLKKEYRTHLTVGIISRASENKSQNLSHSHHIADVMQALYDNDEVVKLTLEQIKSDRTVDEFVSDLSVKREEKTVLVKISYTDYTPQKALDGINAYYKNLFQALTLNLGYNCFEILSPASTPALIDHTPKIVIFAVLAELLIAILLIVIRVFPGVILMTGSDLRDFEGPIIGEIFDYSDFSEVNQDEQ